MTNSVSKTLLQQAGVDDRKPLAAADALIAQGQVEAAQTLLEDLVKQSPGRPDAWFGLGQVKACVAMSKDRSRHSVVPCSSLRM